MMAKEQVDYLNLSRSKVLMSTARRKSCSINKPSSCAACQKRMLKRGVKSACIEIVVCTYRDFMNIRSSGRVSFNTIEGQKTRLIDRGTLTKEILSNRALSNISLPALSWLEWSKSSKYKNDGSNTNKAKSNIVFSVYVDVIKNINAENHEDLLCFSDQLFDFVFYLVGQHRYGFTPSQDNIHNCSVEPFITSSVSSVNIQWESVKDQILNIFGQWDAEIDCAFR